MKILLFCQVVTCTTSLHLPITTFCISIVNWQKQFARTFSPPSQVCLALAWSFIGNSMELHSVEDYRTDILKSLSHSCFIYVMLISKFHFHHHDGMIPKFCDNLVFSHFSFSKSTYRQRCFVYAWFPLGRFQMSLFSFLVL